MKFVSKVIEEFFPNHSKKSFYEGSLNELKGIQESFLQEAMKDDLGKKINDEVLEEMLKNVYQLENLEQDAQDTQRQINKQLEEAQKLIKQVNLDLNSKSLIKSKIKEMDTFAQEAQREYEKAKREEELKGK
ncbi:hypothetical protein [Helicobacter cetorum]|uniref:hypothetical protein n=1 Tax=Helicobacter cetorum TaxID=138563 RepID=UPI000CF19CA7|nr:hypothetical protein [Helicobacter cetorum]